MGYHTVHFDVTPSSCLPQLRLLWLPKPLLQAWHAHSMSACLQQTCIHQCTAASCNSLKCQVTKDLLLFSTLASILHKQVPMSGCP